MTDVRTPDHLGSTEHAQDVNNDSAGRVSATGYVMVPAWVRQRIRDHKPADGKRGIAPSYAADAYVCLGLSGTFRQEIGEYVSITLSYAGLATRMGCSRSTAMRAANVLEAIGALVVQHRVDAAGDATSNLYRLVFGHVTPPAADTGGVPGTPQVVSSGNHGGVLRTPNQEPPTQKAFDQEEKKLANNTSEKPRNAAADKVDRALIAAGATPADRPSIGAYLAQNGKGLGIIAVAAQDGSLPALLTAWRKWAAPVVVPPTFRGRNIFGTTCTTRSSATSAPAHNCDFGWLGEDDDGRAIPCQQCRPHLVPA